MQQNEQRSGETLSLCAMADDCDFIPHSSVTLLFISSVVYTHTHVHLKNILTSGRGRRIWGSISFIPACLILIRSTTVCWLDIIKLITVGYSDCVSHCINSLAHLVSAASQCVGECVTESPLHVFYWGLLINAAVCLSSISFSPPCSHSLVCRAQKCGTH